MRFDRGTIASGWRESADSTSRIITPAFVYRLSCRAHHARRTGSSESRRESASKFPRSAGDSDRIRLMPPIGYAPYNGVCMKSVAETGKERWQRDTLEPALKKSPERAASFTTISGRPIERLYTAEDLDGHRLRARHRRPGRVSLHARHPSDRLPRQALDDAAVRRVRHAGGDQRALQGAAARRRHRAERRVRPADADGPRSRTTSCRSAKSGSAASTSRRWPTWRRCSTASRSATSRRR